MSESRMDPESPIEKITSEGENLYIKLKGEIDLNNSPEIRVAVQQALRDKKITNITIDLKDVPYMDSSGLATLVEIFQYINRQNGKLTLTGLQKRVKSIFEIAKLTGIFDIKGEE